MTAELTAPVMMRDAADWNAPGLEGWDGPVAGYPNRQPPWPPNQFRRFRRVMRISVQREAAWAEECRCIDIENLAAKAEDIPGFVHRREILGHRDATAYFSLDNWPVVYPVLKGAGITPVRIRLFVADWSKPPTRFDLGDGYIAWAHQFRNDPVLGIDESAIFGKDDLARG